MSAKGNPKRSSDCPFLFLRNPYLYRMDYFGKLSDLLKIEWEADKQSYQQYAAASSMAERRAGGLAWYPIIIKDSEIGRGDYLTIEVERTTHQDIPHQFRSGSAVALFSHHDPKNNREEGILVYQNANTLKINLRTDELPGWSKDGKLGIDLLFDDNSYDEMKGALKQAASILKKGEEARLIRILTGEKSPGFQPVVTGVVNGKSNNSGQGSVRLNPSQQSAIGKILSANELAIVHGPPGTGKTTTVVQAVKALINRDHRQVLVVAPSNTAVDLLSEKLSAEGLNVLRVGNPARVSENLLSLTVDNKMAAHGQMKEIKRLKKQAREFRDMAQKYKRNFGKAERDQRKALLDEARNIGKEVERTEQYILDDLLAGAQVITATLVGANHYTIRNRVFHTVVIDEAGQALEPASWIPILKAQKLILAGDHCQLPPTIKSIEAARAGLSTTLLEKCVHLHPEAVVLLEEQYRMNELIMGYSSATFYGGRLKAHPAVAHHNLFEGESPLSFIDTAGCGYDEKSEGTGISNPEEAAFLFSHLTRLVTTLETYYPTKEDFPRIAVISPYRMQIDLLKEQLLHSPVLLAYGEKITVNTIDSFQGQERDIVYIGMTRSNTENKIGFLSDIRRMNVAMTRARKKLVVIGDSATLAQDPFYANFITYAEQHHAYQSAWEFAGQ
jgi:ATP-dependent RNA/DNA helicase IGHMBP2